MAYYKWKELEVMGKTATSINQPPVIWNQIMSFLFCMTHQLQYVAFVKNRKNQCPGFINGSTLNNVSWQTKYLIKFAVYFRLVFHDHLKKSQSTRCHTFKCLYYFACTQIDQIIVGPRVRAWIWQKTTPFSNPLLLHLSAAFITTEQGMWL